VNGLFLQGLLMRIQALSCSMKKRQMNWSQRDSFQSFRQRGAKMSENETQPLSDRQLLEAIHTAYRCGRES
jgi:hypothetical protein